MADITLGVLFGSLALLALVCTAKVVADAWVAAKYLCKLLDDDEPAAAPQDGGTMDA